MSAENTPDLSKIIGVIMEHPELIEQISQLANAAPEEKGEDKKEELPPIIEKEEKTSEAVSAGARFSDSKRRSQLLYALKPYLSEGRARAIDSMLTFGEIFDMMKSGKAR